MGHVSHALNIMLLPVQWPGVTSPAQPPNNNLKLFGGAAFERCLDEFQEAAHALKFPSGETVH